MLKNLCGTRFAVVLFAIVCTWITFNVSSYKRYGVITSDRQGYYVYLPAAFIWHDLGQLEFVDHIDSVYHPNGDTKRYGIYPTGTGKSVIKYPAGVALLEMPFFLAAHAVASGSGGKWTADGYSIPYQLAVSLSALFYACLGLWLLGRFLQACFSRPAVTITLLAIGLGTNLYYYSAFEQGMSHTYSFFLFAGLLFFFHKWITGNNNRLLPLLGLLAGLILITRVSNIIFFVFFLLWPQLRQEVENKYRQHPKDFKAAAFLSLLCFLCLTGLQMMYWKYTTGSFVHYSYEQENFHFGRPEIAKGLLSFRKGWFVYTPVAAVALLGTIALWRQKRAFVIPVTVYLATNIYVVFCWWMWFYGGSFGCRALIESLTVIAVPLCALVQAALTARAGVWRYGLCALLCVLVSLNIFQTYQYSLGTLHWSDMSRKYYWRTFGKLKATPEDLHYLEPWNGKN